MSLKPQRDKIVVNRHIGEKCLDKRILDYYIPNCLGLKGLVQICINQKKMKKITVATFGHYPRRKERP